MIKLKDLLKKESKQTVTEQPIGSYMRYVTIVLNRINQLVNRKALDKITDASKTIEIQKMLAQVEKTIVDTNSDRNNNVSPDATVSIEDSLDRINKLVIGGALNKFTDAGKLIEIQIMLTQVEKAIEGTDGDTNNNGYPDATERNPELARAIRGYGQGRYQGD